MAWAVSWYYGTFGAYNPLPTLALASCDCHLKVYDWQRIVRRAAEKAGNQRGQTVVVVFNGSCYRRQGKKIDDLNKSAKYQWTIELDMIEYLFIRE